VHDGFYAALFHRPEGSAVCLFDELVYLLKAVGSDEEAGSQLPLFLTGHSLGGAIASVFAAALHVEVRKSSVTKRAFCTERFSPSALTRAHPTGQAGQGCRDDFDRLLCS